MKRLKKYIFLLLISILIYNYSCSDDIPVLPPTLIANAGNDQLVEVYDTVYLQGNLKKISSDAKYHWSFDYKPDGSKAKLSDSSSSNPFFISDAQGFYNIKLVIKSGETQSEPDYMLVQSILNKSEQYFPNSVGSKWVYVTTNSFGETDTLTFEIVGETLLQNNDLATIWVSDINSHIYYYSMFDTIYCSNKNDTIIFYISLVNNNLSNINYIVPFKVGDTTYSGSARFIVEDFGQICFGSNTVGNAYTINEVNFFGLNTSLNTHSYIVPNIGLVKKDIFEYDWVGHFEEHWELIYYSLSQ